MVDREVIDEIFAAFHARGSESYLGEPVSLAEHAAQVQAYRQAEKLSPASVPQR